MSSLYPNILSRAEELAACLHTSARRSQQYPDHILQYNTTEAWGIINP